MKRGLQCALLAWVVLALSAAPARSQALRQVLVGARPMGLGGAFVGIADDANAITWNPAGLPQLQRQEVTSMYSDLFGLGVKHLYGGYVFPVSDNNAVGVDTYHIGFDDTELQYGQLKVNLSYGYRWRRILSGGATVKYVRANTGQDNVTLDNAGGVGVDVGLLVAPHPKLRVGVVAQDIGGTSVKHGSGVSEKLFGTNIRGGVAYKPLDPLTVAVDVDDRIHAGVEYWLFNLLGLRGGIQRALSPEARSAYDGDLIYSGGVGVRYRLLQADYAYERHPFLPATQRVSLSLAINPTFVTIKDAVLRPKSIFRSLYVSYQQEDFADVVLKNSAPEPLPVTVSLDMPSLLDRPYQENMILPPQSTTTHAMKVVFPDSLLITEASAYDRLVQPKVTVNYVKDNVAKRTDRSVAPVYVLGRGKMSWDDPSRMGAFVTPEDIAVSSFVNPILQAFKPILYDNFGNSNIGQAMVLFDAISRYGVTYKKDPTTPFLSVSGDRTIFDSIRYPYELLRDKVGDCDDCTVLFCSLLESLDIPTVMLDVNAPGAGHVYMMFDGGINADNARDYFLPNEYVEWQGRAWIPVETTLFGVGDFNTAWRNGVQEYHQRKAEGTINEIDLRTARLVKYPPGRIASAALTPPTKAEIDPLLAADLQQYSNKIRQLVGEPQNTPDGLYDAGTHYLRIGRLREAMSLMDRSLALNPNFLDAHIARGVIYTKMGRYDPAMYDRALDAFNTVLSRDPSNAGARFNIAIVYILKGDKNRALQEYKQATQQDTRFQDALKGILDEP
ncbi:MAG: tetratricopeptide repeat protein [Candidatus Latescibacteria bacterium]|nr:tetratricopeptide repeat protein [Candidatus Latescibacterota bacterium]